MWQRIQTVYILLAVVACVVCLCMPIAEIIPERMGASDTVYNLLTFKADGTTETPICSIIGFILLLSVASESVGTLLLYKHRKKQAKFCLGAVVFILLWNIIFGICAFSGLADHGGEMKPTFASCLPFVAMVLFFLARKAILKDEAKVRAADRIR